MRQQLIAKEHFRRGNAGLSRWGGFGWGQETKGPRLGLGQAKSGRAVRFCL